MRKLLVCQHVPYELLGTLNPLCKLAGFRIRYVNFGRFPDAEPRLDGYHGLVVLGGPMNVDEVDRYPHLTTEVRLVAEALRREIPVLGICLGAQLIAKALGADVRPNAVKEIGWYDVGTAPAAADDPLFRHFRPTERIFQWHGDTFGLPAGAVHLATSPSCTHQAFRYGQRTYGFQFHLEVDEDMIERWLRIPAFLEEMEALHGAGAADRIRAETAAHIGRTKALADHVFRAFIALFGDPLRRRAHPSR